MPIESIENHPLALGILGQGVAVLPFEGQLVAPFSGIVTKVFSNQHTIVITSDFGIKLLIHIGINSKTVSEQLFQTLVSEGELIDEGQQLILFDLIELKKNGVDSRTMIILVEEEQYTSTPIINETVQYFEPLLSIKERGLEKWETHLTKESKVY